MSYLLESLSQFQNICSNVHSFILILYGLLIKLNAFSVTSVVINLGSSLGYVQLIARVHLCTAHQ